MAINWSMTQANPALMQAAMEGLSGQLGIGKAGRARKTREEMAQHVAAGDYRGTAAAALFGGEDPGPYIAALAAQEAAKAASQRDERDFAFKQSQEAADQDYKSDYLKVLQSRSAPDAPSGYRWAEGGELDYIRGGPNDPNTIAQTSQARGNGAIVETLPDGSTRVIPGAGGDNALSRATARNDANAVSDYRSSADTARKSLSTLQQLRSAREGIDYEGGFFPGARARMGGWLGAGAGQNVQSLATDVQLGFTERTKGAISDREMGMFGAATPGLDMTDEAAESRIAGMEAADRRVVEQAKFMESWLDEYGRLSGAQEAWDRFVTEKPIIQADRSGKLRVDTQNVSNWGPYLTGPSTGRGGSPGAPLPSPGGQGAPVQMGGKSYFRGADGQWYEQ